MDDTNLVATEQQECAALLESLEGAILTGLHRIPMPPEWAITARYFTVAALLRLASKLMIAALTDDPDTRQHAQYADMLAEVSRRIAPWSGAPMPTERLH
jgi:hypothetical protein